MQKIKKKKLNKINMKKKTKKKLDKNSNKKKKIKKLNPTRYGDWEIKGRCIDF